MAEKQLVPTIAIIANAGEYKEIIVEIYTSIDPFNFDITNALQYTNQSSSIMILLQQILVVSVIFQDAWNMFLIQDLNGDAESCYK